MGLILEQYNSLTITLLLILRAVQGYVGFLACKGVVEGCRVWFPDHVKLTIGLTNSGYHSGGSTAFLIGGVLYDYLGFTSTLLIAGTICLVLFSYKLLVLPKDSLPVYVNPKNKSSDETVETNFGDFKNEMSGDQVGREAVVITNTNVADPPDYEAVNKPDITTTQSNNKGPGPEAKGLSPLIIIPIISYSILEALVGFTSAITTPYLFDTFEVSISQGGTYLFILYVARFAGSIVSGYIIQKGWATPFQIMAFSAFLSAIGVFILFPNPKLTFLYDNVVIFAYISTLLQGLSNQMCTLAALFAFEEVQVKHAKREMSASSKSKGTTIWLCLWKAFNRVGHLVALLAMEYLTYEQGGYMMLGFCVVSFCTSAGVEIAIRKQN